MLYNKPLVYLKTRSVMNLKQQHIYLFYEHIKNF